jgi:hypothetical protein
MNPEHRLNEEPLLDDPIKQATIKEIVKMLSSSPPIDTLPNTVFRQLQEETPRLIALANDKYARDDIPRQVSLLAAKVMLYMPGSKVVLYSPGQRQSHYLCSLVREHLESVQGVLLSFKWKRKNKETLAIEIDGNIRSVTCLPARAVETRGSGGSLVIFWDVDAMMPDIVNKLLLPVTGPKARAVLCTAAYTADPDWDNEKWFANLQNEGFKYLNFVGSSSKKD